MSSLELGHVHVCVRDECPLEWCLTLASPSFPFVLFFFSSEIVGSLAFVSFSFLFRGMESFWWTTFDGLYWWTCIVDGQSTRWSWHFSKGNDVWSSSKCQKIAMWVQFYSCMALDRTCMVESEWELPLFSFLKKLQDFELERTCISFCHIMRVNKQKFKWSYHASSKGNKYSHEK